MAWSACARALRRPQRGRIRGAAMQRRKTFKRHQRLRLRRDFQQVFGQRCAVSNRYVVLYVARNELAWARLGIQVSRRVGGAVMRNRVRRLLREAFRLKRHELPDGIDIVCVARPVAALRLRDYLDSLPRLVRAAAAKLARAR
jgi:ribonuclease P protein component